MQPVSTVRSRLTVPSVLVLVLALVLASLAVPSAALTDPIGTTGYEPLSPARILDTRDSTGDVSAPVGAGQTVSTTVAGVGGVPADAAAVAINVTAANATEMSHLRVWGSGGAMPGASTINFQPGVNIANMVITEVGVDGKVDIFNFRGSVDVIFDVVGYFPVDTEYVPQPPTRVLDTRDSTGDVSAPVGAGQTVSTTVAG
ncbi:MAG: hypothetical protein ACNA8R_15120, partial [Nitriliruptoraceae bacterium]